jgi:hypothetical protein
MVDDAKEEKKEKAFFKSTAKGAEKMLKEHKGMKKGGVACFSAGGVTNAERAKYGRAMARTMNQKHSGRGK